MLVLAIVCAPAHAGDGAWTLERIMAEMASSARPAVRFREERYLRLTTEPVVVEGTLSYDDGRLEKVSRTPKAERIVIDGDRVRVTAPEQKIDRTLYLVDFPALQALVSSLRGTLDGDLEALKQQFWVDYTANGADWRMVLQPLSDVVRTEVRRVVITGRGGRISSVEVNETAGDRTVIRILDD